MTGPPIFTRVPTLTEIVSMDETVADVDVPAREFNAAPAEPLFAAPAAAVAESASTSDPQAMVDAVLHALHQRLEIQLETKLREALAPALARAADQLITEARPIVVAALREMLQRAVAQEIERREPTAQTVRV